MNKLQRRENGSCSGGAKIIFLFLFPILDMWSYLNLKYDLF